MASENPGKDKALPHLPEDVWKKMTDVQRAAWLSERRRYAEALEEEERRERLRKTGY